ncbi:MAG: hypothetical protein ACSLFD_02510, partial [Solirubrobacterales bacterium]
VRSLEELDRVGELDALIECSAEPSVMSGVDGDTSYLVETNLTGAPTARRYSTSRRGDREGIRRRSSGTSTTGRVRIVTSSPERSR